MRCSGLLQASRANLIFLFLLLFSFSAYGAEVDLKGNSTVSGEKVTLGEIAEIKGTSLEVELLSGIKITDAPPACREKTITKESVANAIVAYLKENGVSVKRIELKGAPRIKVVSNCLIIDRNHLEKLVKDFFRRNYPQYEVLSVPNIRVKLPYRKFKEHLSLDYLGRRSARFVYEIEVNGKTVKKFWLPVRVERKVKVVVAVKPIPKGTRISADEVSLKEVVESRARGGTDNLLSIVGATARRSFLPGEVITGRGIVPNFAVRRNQPVKVIYKSGAIRVELLGIAQQDGVVGNIIKVKNPSTGKVLLCRVVGSGVVEFVSQ